MTSAALADPIHQASSRPATPRDPARCQLHIERAGDDLPTVRRSEMDVLALATARIEPAMGDVDTRHRRGGALAIFCVREIVRFGLQGILRVGLAVGVG
jgi:hypothetical protein